MANWEDRWNTSRISGTDEWMDPDREPFDDDEEKMARKLMGLARWLAGNREAGDGSKYVKTGEYPSEYLVDEREISPDHSVMYLNVVHHGTYWEVCWGSTEFSSSMFSRGRGKTLWHAIRACEDNQ